MLIAFLFGAMTATTMASAPPVSTIRVELAPGHRARLDAREWSFIHTTELNADEVWTFERHDGRRTRVSLQYARLDPQGRGPAVEPEERLRRICGALKAAASVHRNTELRAEIVPGSVPVCRVMRRFGYPTVEQVAFMRGDHVFYLSWETLFPHYPSQRDGVLSLARSLARP